jgi:hypothetical protein
MDQMKIATSVFTRLAPLCNLSCFSLRPFACALSTIKAWTKKKSFLRVVAGAHQIVNHAATNSARLKQAMAILNTS